MFAFQLLADFPVYHDDYLWVPNLLHAMQGCCAPAAAKLDSRGAINSLLTVWLMQKNFGSLVKFAVPFRFTFDSFLCIYADRPKL